MKGLKKRILVADDNPVNRKLTATLIKLAGYNAELATDGLEVVEKYTSSPRSYGIILMDIQMPWTNGIQATEVIRRFEKRQGLDPIPIIGMSADQDRKDKDLCITAGMNDFIPKPVERETMEKIFKRWLGCNSQQG